MKITQNQRDFINAYHFDKAVNVDVKRQGLKGLYIILNFEWYYKNLKDFKNRNILKNLNRMTISKTDFAFYQGICVALFKRDFHI